MGTMRRIFESALIAELRLPKIITVKSGTPLGEVADILCNHRFGCVPIIGDGNLIGIFTERDWLNRVLCRDISLDSPVDKVMTPDPVTLTEFDQIWEAAQIMGEKRIRHVPIVNKHGFPKSMLSVRDVLSYFAECFPEECLAHPPDPSKICLQVESG